MLSVTVYGLLLLYGGLAVALVIDTFPCLTLLALGAVSLLVTLLATHEFVDVVPMVPLCFKTSGIRIRESRLSEALLFGLIPAAATDVTSRRFSVRRHAASLASKCGPVTAWRLCCGRLRPDHAVRDRVASPVPPSAEFGWLDS